MTVTATGPQSNATIPLTMTIPGTATGPVFTPAGGSYSSAQTVTISSPTQGASVRYTTDGSIPTVTTGIVYTSPIAVSATSTVRAIAYGAGLTISAVTSATYTIQP
ncbi:MAG: chitobiase/beta-hexosaminidase C-terminal domain-containing protein [Acidobacteria bacterium]|nr:chitobiase/beta-hexosaminidase C-terminal domain-containing protein [Acidobacteriota bacterium]